MFVKSSHETFFPPPTISTNPVTHFHLHSWSRLQDCLATSVAWCIIPNLPVLKLRGMVSYFGSTAFWNIILGIIRSKVYFLFSNSICSYSRMVLFIPYDLLVTKHCFLHFLHTSLSAAFFFFWRRWRWSLLLLGSAMQRGRSLGVDFFPPRYLENHPAKSVVSNWG